VHLPPSEANLGKVFINEKEIERPPKEMILIFQDYSRSLFPWRTVLKNVLFVLEKKNLTRNERLDIARSALSAVYLSGFENHYPWELSGACSRGCHCPGDSLQS